MGCDSLLKWLEISHIKRAIAFLFSTVGPARKPQSGPGSCEGMHELFSGPGFCAAGRPYQQAQGPLGQGWWVLGQN